MKGDSLFPDLAASTTKPLEREETKVRLLPPYNVILENDDHHSFEFVMGVLRKVRKTVLRQIHEFCDRKIGQRRKHFFREQLAA